LGNLSGTLAVGTYQLNVQSLTRSDIGKYDFAFELGPPTEFHWIEPAGGSFNVGENWDAQVVPDTDKVAVFDRPGTYTVQLQQNVTNDDMRVNGAGVNATLDLNGNRYTLDEIRVGGHDGDDVSLTFADSGVVVAPLGRIAQGGKVEVREAAQWQVQDLSVGTEREGLLKVVAGGSVRSAEARLGQNSAGVGTVHVHDAGSFWHTTKLTVGDSQRGVVTIENGAELRANEIVIGELNTSNGRLTFDNGTLTGNSTLRPSIIVGREGNGFLEVMDGAVVNVDELLMGVESLSEGDVTVASTGQLLVFGSIHVGQQGFATLTVDGGTVEQQSLFHSTQIGRHGTLEVLSGHFSEARELIVNGELTLTVITGSGSASVGQTLLRLPGHLIIGNNGRLLGNGHIRGTVRTIGGGINNFGGIVSPAASPGTLTIDGNYEQLGGTLEIEMAGTAPGQFDVLKVTGDVSLGGDLLLQFIDGFAPRQGDEFTFLDVDGSLAGAFANIEVRGLLPGFQFDLRPDAGGLTMVALNDGVAVPEPAPIFLILASMLVYFSNRLRSTEHVARGARNKKTRQ
jgi:T5SS/PEP-CTERM-associated repeat protein